MQFFPNFPARADQRPDDWAREKEAEGWHGVCASDHLWVGETRYPHVFVAATQMACATQHIRLTTSFCNNLFRSPVEFAQAALSLQRASNGRFEAGLGAGWAQDEIEAMGERYPEGPERVSLYVEALEIVRQLLRTGQCNFTGDYYQVAIEGAQRLLPCDKPPPLIGSAGGPRALREVTPLVDRIEVKASARATRGGALDFAVMASVTEAEVHAQLGRARRAGDVPIGIFVLVAVGTNPQVEAMRAALGNGYLGRFMGPAPTVAAALRELESLGVDRVQLTELVPGSHSELAEHLLDP